MESSGAVGRAAGIVFWLMIALTGGTSDGARAQTLEIAWHAWSDGVFTQAAREHKLVLLEIGAVGCHWCRVMEQRSYGDDAVRELIAERYIAVRVDANARPDIANRYSEYSLPTTVFFQDDASEIVREQGYLPPKRMASLLQAIVDDPSPGPSVKAEPKLTYADRPEIAEDVKSALKKAFAAQYDVGSQGWAFGLRYLDADSTEYANQLAREGDQTEQKLVRGRLAAGLKLIDPVWGGAYQSLVVAVDGGGVSRFARVQVGDRPDPTGESWNDPHYEKTLRVQAETMRLYAASFGQWKAEEYRAAAESVHRYVRAFLTSGDGAYYAGQDGDVGDGTNNDSVAYFALDDSMRRTAGVPLVDRHLYARENGWMIEALCVLYDVTHDATALEDAKRAASWVMIHRRRPDGGFAHDERDGAGPFLGDTLAMGQAFLALYGATGDSTWLQRARAARGYIAANFGSQTGAGFVTVKAAMDRRYGPRPDREENAAVVRFASGLAKLTGDAADREVAARAMRYLATREVAADGMSAEILLAEREFLATGK